MLTRRTVLCATGTALTCGLAGCSSVPLLSPDVPRIESKQIEVVSSQCVKEGNRQREASLSYDYTRHQLSVRGVTVTNSPCAELFINPKKGVGQQEFKNDSYQIIVDIRPVGECKPCPGELAYSATVTFSHAPSTIYVYHTEEVDDRLRPIGPINAKTIK